MFNIADFRSNGAAYGFTRPAFFLLQIATPPQFWSGGDTRFLSYLCSAASLPGVAIQASGAKRFGYGPVKKIPYDLVHSDINLTIYSDGAGQVIDFFDQWNRNIISFGDVLNPIQGAMYGQVQYPEHYETDINLLYFNEAPGETGIELVNYTMTDAYPTGMAEIPLDWSQSEAISVVQIPITYRTYSIQVNSASGYGGFGDNPLEIASDYLSLVAGGRNGGFANINGSIRDAIGMAESLGSGVIDISGQTINFSAAVGAISSGSASLTQSLGIVSSLNSGFNFGF